MSEPGPQDAETVREWCIGSARGAYLTHFPPGEVGLGEAHRRWLTGFAGRVGPLAGNLYIVGLTDRAAIGDERRGLDTSRAREVYRFLRRAPSTMPRLDVHVGSTGDSIAGSDAERVARHGAVAVVHVPPGRVPIRWLREMEQREPEPSSVFYIRAIGSGIPSVEARSGEVEPQGSGARPFALGLEICDGRWSLVYRAFVEVGKAGTFKVGPMTPGVGHEPAEPAERRRTAGPWHTFRSPFDLRVQGFGRNPVGLIGGTATDAPLALRLVRPGLVISPFDPGQGLSPSALLDLLGAPPAEAPGRRVLEGRLDSAGAAPHAHSIPAEIRAYLRRGRAPGPATLERAAADREGS